MKHAQAWAPGNLSLLFAVVPHPDPAIMGSLGMGFTIDKGVTAEVRVSDTQSITFNGAPIHLPTVEHAAQSLTQKPIAIALTSELPIASGFGVSGASTLSSVHAINKLLDLKKDPLELAKIAHIAEVVNKTGLGDVANQALGGFGVKFVSSSQFAIERLPLVGIPVYCLSKGKIETSSILSNPAMIDDINTQGHKSLAVIKSWMETRKPISFADTLTISKTFVKHTGLLALTTITPIINEVEKNGGHASMIILGDAVMSDIPFDGAIKLLISDIPAHTLSHTTLNPS